MTDTKSDEIDTIAYAVSYYEAAQLIADSTDWADNNGLIVPFFALIGFSLENGLKAVLEFRKVDQSIKWTHSHCLTKLRDLARGQGLSIAPHVDDLIEQLAVPHFEHHFRYPQKATTLSLMKPPSVAAVTNDLLKAVFVYIDGPNRR